MFFEKSMSEDGSSFVTNKDDKGDGGGGLMEMKIEGKHQMNKRNGMMMKREENAGQIIGIIRDGFCWEWRITRRKVERRGSRVVEH